jgi:hypothetical protein
MRPLTPSRTARAAVLQAKVTIRARARPCVITTLPFTPSKIAPPMRS